MASAHYSFIDIAVLDEVRRRFAAGEALALLSTDLDEILWANGPGAAFFGYGEIEAAIGAPSGFSRLARRQIEAVHGFPMVGRDRPVAVRLGGGLVNFIVSGVVLPDGERALLLVLPAAPPGDAESLGERAISGLNEAGHFAALVDAEGEIVAASRAFDGLGISRNTLRGLVDEVRSEPDRLVKRVVSGAPRRYPAGIARLTDEPALHLLVVVDEPETAGAIGMVPSGMAAQEDGATVHAREAGAWPAPSADGGIEEETLARLAPSSGAAGHDGGTVSHAPRHAQAGDLSSPEEEKTAEAPAAVRDRLEKGPVRFAWRTDADTRFSSISPEFAAAVGPPAADIVGRSFAEVADAFGLDPDGEIAGLLERRDTWSGRTVLWPVAGTDLRVPVDLAALPVYGRERRFEGFRGFGIARGGDAKTDPGATGLHLVAPAVATAPDPSEPAQEDTEAAPTREEEPAPPREQEPSSHDGQEPAPPPGEAPPGEAPPREAKEEEPALADPFRGEVPAITFGTPGPRDGGDKVIHLSQHRPVVRENGLSQTEQSAFREIAERLRRDSSADSAETAGAVEADKVSPGKAREAADAEEADKVSPGKGGESVDADGIGTTWAGNGPERADHLEEGGPALAVGGNETLATTQERASESAGAASARPADVEVPDHEEGTGRTAVDLAFLPSAFSGAVRPRPASPGVDTAILAHLPVPVLVHTGDTLHFANREFLALTGYDALAALEESGGLGAIFADPYEGEAPVEPSDRTLRLRTAGGEEFPVEAHLQSIPWNDGKALLLALRRAVQPAVAAPPAEHAEELEIRLAELRTIVDTATDGVVIIDNDGMIRSISRPAEALFGVDSAEIAGQPFTALFAIESQRAAEDYLESLADNGVASVLNDGREVIGREAQGRFIPLFMTIGRLPQESGFCAVVRDITQWKRAEEELTQARAQAERSSSQKTEFLARVSHEIRTPLNAIIGFSELMLDERFGPIGSDRYRDYLRDINRSGNHVLDLVNDLLDISKIEAGEQDMHYEAVSLNEALAEIVAMMQPQANRDRVIIRSCFASRLPDVVADLRSVRQIGLNLLSNAIRYTQAGGQVVVSTFYEQNGAVVMRVRDTGIGMSAAELDQALKPFKQLNTFKRGRGDGTGLGLPLTRAMVEANRARFSISSTPGQGTLVEVTFPPTRVLAD